MSTLATPAAVYLDGRYLEQHPLWHTEHSAWKAEQVLNMIRRAGLRPNTVCEVGCGAGEMLRMIQESLSPNCQLRGFDISPQAIQLCRTRANDRLRFCLVEKEQEIPDTFDLLVSVDVIEHIEDYLGHLRQLRSKAAYKIFHVPLDISVQSVLRAKGLTSRRDDHAHLHYFTKETFLRSLTDVGYQIRDVVYTKRSVEIGSGFRQSMMSLPRRIAFRVNQDITARVFGGFSLAVLAS